MGGGNVTYAVNNWLLPYIEYSYFPAIGTTVSVPAIGAKASFGIPLSDFHGGVHLRFRIGESHIAPYAVFGIGALTHFKTSYNATYIGADSLPHTLSGSIPAGSDFAINAGGGIRYYITEKFGVRAEAKVYKANSSITQVFGKVEAGFFFQLR